MSDDAASRLGTKIGNYRLVDLLGRGAMGTVYKADHAYLGKRVAVKVLHSQFAGHDEYVKRFLREAWAASTINHPNIVQVTDFGMADDGSVFLVMEYLEGSSLDAVLARERRLALSRALTIMTQITSALAAAHAAGIFHRDLKPENMVLTQRPGRRALVRQVSDHHGVVRTVTEPEGVFDFVKILDFGVAKVVRPQGSERTQEVFDDIATTGGTFFGTAEYVAPETARGAPPDPRGDIYSAGVIFYEMLTGTVPFQGATPMDTLLQQIAEPVPPLRERAPDAEITDQAEKVVLRALAKEPAERYPSMVDLHADLQLCYGTVRYKREVARLEVPPPSTAGAGIGAPPVDGDFDIDLDLEEGLSPPPPPPSPLPPSAGPGAPPPILLTKVRRPRS